MISDTGRNLSIFPIGKAKPFTEEERNWQKDMVGGKDGVPVSNIAGPKSYVDLESAFAQPDGSRAVTKRVMQALNNLTPSELNKLDNIDLRRAASDLHDLYSRQNKKKNLVRPDFLHMLEVIREKGLRGLQAAYRKKEFFPVLVALSATGMEQNDGS